MGEHVNANKNNDKNTHTQWENLLEMAHVVCGVHQVSNLFNAPPNSLINSTMILNVKTMEG